MQTLVMGTRGSPLALAQSRQVAASLVRAHDGLRVEERIITTTGDRQQGASLPSIGGKGVFTLEIERALLDGSIDFAVHSLKDLPPEFPAGLHLSAVPSRASACDVCLIKTEEASDAAMPLSFLPPAARVGTSSLRRRAQLLHARPDLEVLDVRGNIDTRVQKLQNQPYDAIILAAAGLERLDLRPAVALHHLDETTFVPAPGQGALALECRIDDAKTNALLMAVNSEATRAEIEAERAAMSFLGAGCSTPLGARAVCKNEMLELWACVLSPDGSHRIFARGSAANADAKALGEIVARDLLNQGAQELMQASTVDFDRTL